MQKNYYFLLILLFGFVGISCNQNKNEDFGIFEGKWQIKATNILVEEWRKENDTLFIGNSYMQKGDSTIPMETIKLIFHKDSTFYIPIVPNPNAGKPVSFYLTKKTDSLFVFENPKHDFPQRIIYAFSGKNKLLVTIDGKIKDAYRKEDFDFERQ